MPTIPLSYLLAAALLATVAPSGQAAAQALSRTWPSRPVIVLPPPPPGLAGTSAATPDPLLPPETYPRTHWKEGGIVGGVVVGILGALLVDGLCSNSDSGDEHCGTKTLGGAALGVGVGFTIGALIGGQFPKSN